MAFRYQLRRWVFCSTNVRLLRAQLWPPNRCCTKDHQLGTAAVPCQPRARCNDLRDKRFDTPTPGSLWLGPLSHRGIDKTNDPRFSESAQMRYAKKQLEAQRAKFAAKDTNDSAWLLWKQLLWVVRNGCRHCRAWQWWKITQYTPTVCAWCGEEQNFCIFFPYFPVIREPNSDENWGLYSFVTGINFIFKSWFETNGEQLVKAAYRVGIAIFCVLWKKPTPWISTGHSLHAS